jgi:hypothetical protein
MTKADLKGCYIFHRWEQGSSRQDINSKATHRIEAGKLLGCATRPEDVGDDEIRWVNGKASFGNPDDAANDDTRHTLCIAGGKKDGESKQLPLDLSVLC